MLPPTADRPKLQAVLDQLSAAVEELLLSGLTTASDSTRQTLSTAMREAARFKLLRLGSALRVAMEELSRFTRQDQAFSRRRLAFFLNRGWLLSRGLSHALRTANEAEYDRLNWSPPTRPVPAVEVVCIGAVKRVAAGAFVAFEFRLRATTEVAGVTAGQKLSWSAVFPVKPGVDIPPEGFLHLPQKQKFKPSLFLDGATVRIENAAISADEPAGRLLLTDQSKITVAKRFSEWERFLAWSPATAAERLSRYNPGPLDLESELQEEVVLRDYKIGAPEDGDEPGQSAYSVMAGPLTLNAVVGPGAEGAALRKRLDDLRKVKKDRPPLYGLMHYERCRLVFQPLTAFGKDGPDYLTISKENINKAALLKAMSFT